MKKGLKKWFILVIVALFQLSSMPIGETTPGFFAKSNDLNYLLEDKIFSAFSTDNRYFNIDALGMCNGEILLDCVASSEFGWRVHPRRRRTHFHTGIDLAAPKGAFVFAPADGVVKMKGWSRGYGRMVHIDHGFTWSTKYAHLSKIYVKKGQNVKKGDIIGEVGSSGVSTGPHLHFEMIYFGTAVNPRSYFAALDNLNGPAFIFANR